MDKEISNTLKIKVIKKINLIPNPDYYTYVLGQVHSLKVEVLEGSPNKGDVIVREYDQVSGTVINVYKEDSIIKVLMHKKDMQFNDGDVLIDKH